MPHFIFIQQISVLNILNMLYNLHFFLLKCRLFHNATFTGSCITYILNTGCAKIWKKVRRQKVKSRGPDGRVRWLTRTKISEVGFVCVYQNHDDTYGTGMWTLVCLKDLAWLSAREDFVKILTFLHVLCTLHFMTDIRISGPGVA